MKDDGEAAIRRENEEAERDEPGFTWTLFPPKS